MKELNIQSLSKFTTSHQLDNVQVVIMKGQGISKFSADEDSSVLLPNACLLNFSQNNLSLNALSQLWNKFPSAWWVDLSENPLNALDCSFPLAMGSLNIRKTQVTKTELHALFNIYILRIHVDINEEDTKPWDVHQMQRINPYIARALPNVWVANEDFITCRDRAESARNQTTDSTENEDTHSQAVEANKTALGWRIARTQARETNLLRAIQSVPIAPTYADDFKLDILLEDYLQQTAIHNTFVARLDTSSSSGLKTVVSALPRVDVTPLLYLPHRLRLDLSVVLTTSILLPIPQKILTDALILLLGKFVPLVDLDQICRMPRFARTAVVSLLRRISRRELDELKLNKCISPKPTAADTYTQKNDIGSHSIDAELPDFLSWEGFTHLRVVRRYLEQPLESAPREVRGAESAAFSEMELEILQKLPNTPNLSCGRDYFDSLRPEAGSGVSARVSYEDWISFAARHTVMILVKAPSCPPLTRAQNNKVHQELYLELLPLLRAAGMTLQDLDISLTGPGRDGRVLHQNSLVSGVPSETLEAQKKLLGGNRLIFGAGLPRGVPEGLSWNVNGVARAYAQPWNGLSGAMERVEGGEPDEAPSSVFLTGGEGAAQPAVNYSRTAPQTLIEGLHHPSRAEDLGLDSDVLGKEVSQECSPGKRSPSRSPTRDKISRNPALRLMDQVLGDIHSEKNDSDAPLSILPGHTLRERGMVTLDQYMSPHSGGRASFDDSIDTPYTTNKGTPAVSRVNTSRLLMLETEDPGVLELLQQVASPDRTTPLRDSTGRSSSAVVPRAMTPLLPHEKTPALDHWDAFVVNDDLTHSRIHTTGAGQKGTSTYRERRKLIPQLAAEVIERSRSMITLPSEQQQKHLNTFVQHPRSVHDQSDVLQVAPVGASQYRDMVEEQVRQLPPTLRPFTPGGSPARDFSPEKSLRREALKPVIGFSADAQWDASFLLAPPRAVARFNHAVYEDERRRWDHIEHAPVLVTAPVYRVSGSLSQLSVDRGHEMTMTAQQTPPKASPREELWSLGSDDKEFAAFTSSKGDSTAAKPILIPLVQRQEGASQGIKQDYNNNNNQNNKNKTKVSVSVGEGVGEEQGKQSPGKESIGLRSQSHHKGAVTFSDVGDGPGEKKGPRGSFKKKGKEVFRIGEPKGSTPIVDGINELESLKEAAHQLMVEMGTVRNLRHLSLSNVPNNSSRKTSTNTSKPSLKPSKNPFSSDRPPNWRMLAQDQKAPHGASHSEEGPTEDVVFLTGLTGEADPGDEELVQGVEEDNLATHCSHLETTNRGLREAGLRSGIGETFSTLDLAKLKTSYQRIYTFNQGIEQAPRAVNGRALAPTWYPRWDKKIYHLSMESLLPTPSSHTLPTRSEPSKSLSQVGFSISALESSEQKGKGRPILKPLSTKVFENSVLKPVPHYVQPPADEDLNFIPPEDFSPGQEQWPGVVPAQSTDTLTTSATLDQEAFSLQPEYFPPPHNNSEDRALWEAAVRHTEESSSSHAGTALPGTITSVSVKKVSRGGRAELMRGGTQESRAFTDTVSDVHSLLSRPSDTSSQSDLREILDPQAVALAAGEGSLGVLSAKSGTPQHVTRTLRHSIETSMSTSYPPAPSLSKVHSSTGLSNEEEAGRALLPKGGQGFSRQLLTLRSGPERTVVTPLEAKRQLLTTLTTQKSPLYKGKSPTGNEKSRKTGKTGSSGNIKINRIFSETSIQTSLHPSTSSAVHRLKRTGSVLNPVQHQPHQGRAKEVGEGTKEKVGHHRYLGQHEEPWVGMNRYGAAPHISLNRSFRLTKPGVRIKDC